MNDNRTPKERSADEAECTVCEWEICAGCTFNGPEFTEDGSGFEREDE